MHIEAYYFEGIVQPFPNHGCAQNDGGSFNYRGFNIPRETMLDLTEEVTGKRYLPEFTQSVVVNVELNSNLQLLHKMIMDGSKEFEKDELLIFLISALIEQYGQPFEKCIPDCREEIEMVCLFIEQHFAEHISLENLVTYSSLSKSTLLRGFTKWKGVTPYRYLQAIRINKAKELLEQGLPPIEAAMQTGFSDQSHFSNFFNMFIGLPPAAYGNIFKGNGGKNEK